MASSIMRLDSASQTAPDTANSTWKPSSASAGDSGQEGTAQKVKKERYEKGIEENSGRKVLIAFPPLAAADLSSSSNL